MALSICNKNYIGIVFSLAFAILGVVFFVCAFYRLIPIGVVWGCFWISTVFSNLFKEKFKVVVVELWGLLFVLGFFSLCPSARRFTFFDFPWSITSLNVGNFLLSVLGLSFLMRCNSSLLKFNFLGGLYFYIKILLFAAMFSLMLVGLKFYLLGTIVLLCLGFIFSYYWLFMKTSDISWSEIILLYLLSFLISEITAH